MDLMTRKLKRFALESVLVPRARPALDPDFSLPNNADQEVKKRSGNEGVQLGYRQTQAANGKRRVALGKDPPMDGRDRS